MTKRKQYKVEYDALINAIHRCHNPRHAAYYNYGARGITVCPEWHGRDGFDRFLDHVGPKSQADLTIDRIDNDLGYQPSNVRWATRKQQTENRRNREHFTVARDRVRNGEIVALRRQGMTAVELAAIYELGRSQIGRIVAKARA